jgi:hypothetical protein
LLSADSEEDVEEEISRSDGFPAVEGKDGSKAVIP